MIPKAKHISFTQAINDYDGDGAKDLIVVWHDPVNPRKRYLNVYSINKKEYLLVTKEPVEANQVTADDFDNDDLTELVVGSKIFEYSEPVIKKITE